MIRTDDPAFPPIIDYNHEAKAFVDNVAISFDELKAFVDQILDLTDIDYVKDEHLDILGSILGYPFTKEDSSELKRKLIKTAIDFYKAKGTAECFRILFYNLGYDLEVIPLWTADKLETDVVRPPYIRVASTLPSSTEGLKDVTVINPITNVIDIGTGLPKTELYSYTYGHGYEYVAV